MTQVKVVYLDCTFTHQSGLNTGIQRVVRSIIARAGLLESEFGVKIIPIVSVFGRYYRVSINEILNQKSMTATTGTSGKAFLKSVKARYNRVFGSSRLTGKLFGILECSLKKLFSAVKFSKRVLWLIFRRDQRVIFEAMSCLVVMDAFWTYDLIKSIQSGGKALERVVTVIYDMIPILHPQFVEDVNRLKYSRTFPDVINVSDRLICISKSVASDVEKFLGASLKRPIVDSFQLGFDFRDKSMVDKGDFECTQFDHESWIAVGTIEPRKNYAFLLDCFDELWRQGRDEKLTIIGRVGWMCEDLIERIVGHERFGKDLFFFPNMSDVELAFCYRNSKGLILASLAEGFGLPLVEAMSFGVKVLCSDIPIFREVGGGYPLYFDPKCAQSLIYAIEISYGHSGLKTNTTVNWDSASRELFIKIM